MNGCSGVTLITDKQEHVQTFTKKIQQDTTVYQNFISYFFEAQHVNSGVHVVMKTHEWVGTGVF